MKRFTLLIGTLLMVASCNDEVTGLGPPSDPATETFAPSLGVNISQMTRFPEGVYVSDLIIGSGDEVVLRTDTVWVTYAGYLKDGKLIDSGTNVKFEPGSVIAGLRAGLLGMRVGGRRKLVIPSELAYGGVSRKDPSTGKILIPRQSTLVFDVDLLRLHTAPDPATTP
jgi:FKBP-type peptidyl-prolyl cis-trans isomerase FkpA